MGAHLLTAAVLALAVGSGAWTVCKTHISRPFRVWVAGHDGGLWDWANQLLACPYCTSHWLSFAAVGIWRPWLITGWAPARFVVTSLAVVAMASVVVLVIKKALT